MSAAQKSDKILLDVVKRDILGKKVKKIRKKGLIPGNVYGHGFTSTAVQAENKPFLKTYHLAGETQVIYLQLDKKEIPVMVQNLQLDPLTEAPLHVDFKKVDLSKKIETQVPVKIIGESPAVSKGADLLTLIDSILVEALPTAVPQEIEVDVSSLVEIDAEIKISDLKGTKGYEIKEEADAVVAKVVEHKEEELEAELPDEDEVVEGEEDAKEGSEEGKEETKEKPAEDGDKKKEE